MSFTLARLRSTEHISGESWASLLFFAFCPASFVDAAADYAIISLSGFHNKRH
jgi:hypothetical protein